MKYLTSSFTCLLDPFQNCFRIEAFDNFKAFVVSWILCVRLRTISHVIETGQLHHDKHHDAFYHLFSDAQWDTLELEDRLLISLVQFFAPNGPLYFGIDDTLCHKRGAHIAFGGFFLDPVLSSKSRKTFCFAVNQIVLALLVQLPFRPDRFFALPSHIAPFKKKTQPNHKKRTEIAAELGRRVAKLFSDRIVYIVADQAYVNKALLKDRPNNLHVVGPIPSKAVLYKPAKREPKRKGRPRLKGDRLPSPKELFESKDFPQKKHRIQVADKQKEIQIQVLDDVLWYNSTKQEKQKLVLVKDPSEVWRPLCLLSTDKNLSVEQIIEIYCRRWSMEVMFRDCKQDLGLSDPQVRLESSVTRVHSMAYWCYSLTILWFAQNENADKPKRNRPWYQRDPNLGPTFREMLGALRLKIWNDTLFQGDTPSSDEQSLEEKLDFLLNFVAIVQ